jgi:hypothetical protein
MQDLPVEHGNFDLDVPHRRVGERSATLGLKLKRPGSRQAVLMHRVHPREFGYRLPKVSRHRRAPSVFPNQLDAAQIVPIPSQSPFQIAKETLEVNVRSNPFPSPLKKLLVKSWLRCIILDEAI